MQKELMFAGIILIISSLVLGVISIIAFIISGKKLKSELNKDYGDNG